MAHSVILPRCVWSYHLLSMVPTIEEAAAMHPIPNRSSRNSLPVFITIIMKISSKSSTNGSFISNRQHPSCLPLRSVISASFSWLCTPVAIRLQHHLFNDELMAVEGWSCGTLKLNIKWSLFTCTCALVDVLFTYPPSPSNANQCWENYRYPYDQPKRLLATPYLSPSSYCLYFLTDPLLHASDASFRLLTSSIHIVTQSSVGCAHPPPKSDLNGYNLILVPSTRLQPIDKHLVSRYDT